MRLSQSEQLRNIHTELVRLARPFPNPPKLDQDRCLARVLKFSLCIASQKGVSPKSLERSLQEFKDDLPSHMRKETQRDDLLMLARNILAKRQEIMSVEIQSDVLEQQGFAYSDTTFDDLFIKKWSLFGDAESSSSDAEDEKA